MISRSSAAWPRIGLTPPVLGATVLLFFVVLYNNNNSNNTTTTSVNQNQVDGASISQLRNGQDDYLHNLYASLNGKQRCLDPDDPPTWFTKKMAREHPCTCPDPTQPLKRKDTRGRVAKPWMDHHDRTAAKAQQVPRQGLDVVLFGDSITERWMGTKAMGQAEKPEFRHVFEKYFNKTKGGLLNGEAFGTGGDTAPELFWHLKNGWLPKRLQPRAILLLIGTNDLGLPMCSKKNTLAGILHIATFLAQKRPDAKLILHGLTPRNEFYGDRNMDLGVRWEQIKWINQQLRDYVEQQANWFYIDNSDIFFRQDNPNMINETLMKDALHPTVKGYALWAPRLSQQIHDILESNP